MTVQSIDDRNKGLIFDIQSFSVHDGPGCRTTIFLMGCPLRCRWCCNPECFVAQQHIMFAARSCKHKDGCTACMDRCPSSALTFPADNALSPELDFDKCRDCNSFDCAECCPNNALKVCGRKYDVEELMTVIRRDFSHWGVDGGVTFSGGEPMLQHDFLSDVLQRCKELQIHTAIETSSCVDTEIYLNIMRHVDFAFVDIKHTNRERHKEGTGVYNDLILHNISQLKKANFGQRIIVRQPTILGFNDDNKNAEDLIRYMHENDLFEINLLKFHRMGESKWNQLGHDYPYHTGGEVSDERMLELQRLYLDNDIACYIGHDTSF